MAIEKKSLVGKRAPVKNAKMPTQSSESIGENKPLKVQTLKATPKIHDLGR